MNKKEKEIEGLEELGFKAGWCDICHCTYILCPKCGNSSCNGGGCAYCHPDISLILAHTDFYSFSFEQFKEVFPEWDGSPSPEIKLLNEIFANVA